MGEQSAARLEGDRYQHLYSWYLILSNLMNPASPGDSVWLEHPHAGSADDVTVFPVEGSLDYPKYYQVKWHVDHRSGYSMESLITSHSGSQSMLEKFWTSWKSLRKGGTVEIWLVSNWSCIAGDPLGGLIDGRNYRLSDDLITAGPKSSLGIWRHRWQDHLQASTDEFENFYKSLRFRLGFASISDLNEMVDLQMKANGLKTGELYRRAVVDLVRDWIEEGGDQKVITQSKVQKAINKFELLLPDSDWITVSFHNWTKRKTVSQPQFELDWSEHFDHLTRRVPSAETWDEQLIPQLRGLEQSIANSRSSRSIRLFGRLSLSAAIAFGQIFSTAAGYRLELQHHNHIWQSDIPPDENVKIEVSEEEGDSRAREIVWVINVTGDASQAVRQYLTTQNIRFRSFSVISPIGGAHDFSIQGASNATAIARLVRIELRKAINNYEPLLTHMFYFGPQSLGVFIGQKLNACGQIQLYEYQNPGYIASCRLK